MGHRSSDTITPNKPEPPPHRHFKWGLIKSWSPHWGVRSWGLRGDMGWGHPPVYFGVEKRYGALQNSRSPKRISWKHLQAACPTQAGSILCAMEVWSMGCKPCVAKPCPALRKAPLSITKLRSTGRELVVCATAPFLC